MKVPQLDEVQDFHLVNDGFTSFERISTECELCGFRYLDTTTTCGMELCRTCSTLISSRIRLLRRKKKCPIDGSRKFLWQLKNNSTGKRLKRAHEF